MWLSPNDVGMIAVLLTEVVMAIVMAKAVMVMAEQVKRRDRAKQVGEEKGEVVCERKHSFLLEVRSSYMRYAILCAQVGNIFTLMQ